MRNREAGRAPQVVRDEQAATLEAFFDNVVRAQLTPFHVFGALANARVANDQLVARCPLHGGHECRLDPKTLAWACASTGESGGPLEFVRRQIEASGASVLDSTRRAIAELARRCDLELPTKPPPVPQTQSEAEMLWQTSTASVLADEAATCWLARHGLSAAAVESYDAMRVIALGAALPEWAGFTLVGRRYPWTHAGYRLVVPLVSATGSACALLFCNPIASSGARLAAPVAVPCVMADSLACCVLASRGAPRFLRDERLTVEVVGGVTAFLRQVTGRNAVSQKYRPVLGLVGGALDPAFLSRLPNGTHLISTLDRSSHGDRMHAGLERLVEGSGHDVTLSRSESP
jgi:hypothetical protein